MTPITQIGKMMTQLVGTAGKVTITKAQLPLFKSQLKASVYDELVNFCGKYKNPKLTLASKFSERGYAIAGFSIKDGKEIIGNGAISVAGKAGKASTAAEPTVFKVRANLGKGGDTLSLRGHVDKNQLGKVKVTDELECAFSSKNLVEDVKIRAGKACNIETHVNMRELAKYSKNGSKELQEMIKNANSKLPLLFGKIICKLGI